MGKHYLLNLYDCPFHLLDDLEFIVSLLKEAAILCDATILNVASHKFEPQGVTVVIMLAESHISLHSWPDNGTAACDVYTCSEKDPKVGCDHIIKGLEAKNNTLIFVGR
jgi:S-adenosylmethionine decarboxylase